MANERNNDTAMAERVVGSAQERTAGEGMGDKVTDREPVTKLTETLQKFLDVEDVSMELEFGKDEAQELGGTIELGGKEFHTDTFNRAIERWDRITDKIQALVESLQGFDRDYLQ